MGSQKEARGGRPETRGGAEGVTAPRYSALEFSRVPLRHGRIRSRVLRGSRSREERFGYGRRTEALTGPRGAPPEPLTGRVPPGCSSPQNRYLSPRLFTRAPSSASQPPNDEPTGIQMSFKVDIRCNFLKVNFPSTRLESIPLFPQRAPVRFCSFHGGSA